MLLLSIYSVTYSVCLDCENTRLSIIVNHLSNIQGYQHQHQQHQQQHQRSFKTSKKLRTV